MPSLKKIILPPRYNYIACFLTFRCNLKCEYCVNSYGSIARPKNLIISAEEWIIAINRLECSKDLPITIQGGEPSLHPGFIGIIKNIRPDLKIDMLTNLSFDIDNFIAHISPQRFKRDLPYPSIRVSYHPKYADLDEIIYKVMKMLKAGFCIGVFGILHPEFQKEIFKAREKCQNIGIDFRIKEFLGVHNGQLYGTYYYQEAVTKDTSKKCLCRISELLIDPGCNVYRCHRDLYKSFLPIGSLLDDSFEVRDVFRGCNHFGDCNPCDVKLKTNRFQKYGHTSVEIKAPE